MRLIRKDIAEMHWDVLRLALHCLFHIPPALLLCCHLFSLSVEPLSSLPIQLPRVCGRRLASEYVWAILWCPRRMVVRDPIYDYFA